MSVPSKFCNNFLSIWSLFFLSVSLSRVSLSPSICLSTSPIYSLSVHHPFCLCLSVSLSLSTSVCLSVCLSAASSSLRTHTSPHFPSDISSLLPSLPPSVPYRDSKNPALHQSLERYMWSVQSRSQKVAPSSSTSLYLPGHFMRSKSQVEREERN